MSEKERRKIKYLVGKKDECIKIKNKIIEIIDKEGEQIMSEADKMFEELEYKKYKSEDGNKEKYIRNGLEIILFDNERHIVTAYIWNDGAREIPKVLDMQELQAINKKVEELKWKK